MALRMGHRTILVAPLLRQNEAIGAIAIRRMEVKPFTEKQVELITTFADQAVIAIENVRLFEAEQQRSRELTESLQLQIATADVLKIISRSAFDLRTVLQTLVEIGRPVLRSRQGRNCPPERWAFLQRGGLRLFPRVFELHQEYSHQGRARIGVRASFSRRSSRPHR